MAAAGVGAVGDRVGGLVKERFKAFLSDYRFEVAAGESSQGQAEEVLVRACCRRPSRRRLRAWRSAPADSQPTRLPSRPVAFLLRCARGWRVACRLLLCRAPYPGAP
jgi:hypothetical protein